MLQIRGRDKQNNLTYVGEWIKIPQIAKVISCVGGYSTDRATIVDKGKKMYFEKKKKIFEKT